MKFFAKVVFIFNLCSIGYVVFRYLEMSKKVVGNSDVISPLPWFKNTVVTLGWIAIFVNLLFCLTAIAYYLLKKSNLLAKWLTVINFIFLFLQIYYFFIYNE
jgi:hypothetical protein